MKRLSSNLPTFCIFLGNADGTFAAPVEYDSSMTSSKAIADLDGNGTLDLVIAQPGFESGDNVGVFPGDGDGTFALLGGGC